MLRVAGRRWSAAEGPEMTADAVEPRWQQWPRLTAAGIAPIQRGLVTTEGRVREIRTYQDQIVPGLLQTEPYARAVLAACIRFVGAPDDIDESVAARMERQVILRERDRKFGMLLAEHALYTSVGGPEVMESQLRYLSEVMDLPHLTLGIVPKDAPFFHLTTGFVISDRSNVTVETVSANLTITSAEELDSYEKAWTALGEVAVYDDHARRIIDYARAHLDRR
jgi:hypothetical protein